MLVSCHLLLFFCILSFTFLHCNCSEIRYGYITLKNEKLEYHEGNVDLNMSDYIVRANFDNKINSTGWAFLEIETSDHFNDSLQAYAAGYIEGLLTPDLIWLHWLNTMDGMCNDKKWACFKIKRFLNQNEKWILNMINSNTDDPYWYQVKLYLLQLEGLADGYNKIMNEPQYTLSRALMLVFNLQGDLEDLFKIMGAESGTFVKGLGRCSALIKILEDGSDLYTSQVTWNSYQSMLRIQKKYILKYNVGPGINKIIPGHTMSFSSYPAQLQSGDDFYILSSGLIAQETTIDNSNEDLFPNTKPIGQLMEFVRCMVANRLADSGKSWTDIFKKYNSGTYNNQWMIIDYNKFQSGKNGKYVAKSGLLWILEQLPGYVEAQDMTEYLKKTSYWPSYNIPYFSNIFNLAGYPDTVAKYGDWFTYNKHPRALIFKRDHSKVKNMDDMFTLMRYNNFKHDPLSKCQCDPPYSAENAISARNDLNLINGTYPFPALSHRSHGATDAKITNIKMLKSYQFLSTSGPTYNDSLGLPAFKWSNFETSTKIAHFGHPDIWQFKPVTHIWKWN